MPTLKIIRDTCPENPREWCNLFKMALFHRRYSLPNDDKISMEEAKEIFEDDAYISRRVYGYDHGGLTINMQGFHCPWDSGQLGIIYISKADYLREYPDANFDEACLQKIYEHMLAEVETYDQYLLGDVWGFEATYDDGSEDSCWGFYGSDPKTNGMADHLNIPLESFTIIQEDN